MFFFVMKYFGPLFLETVRPRAKNDRADFLWLRFVGSEEVWLHGIMSDTLDFFYMKPRPRLRPTSDC
jgi:hypothetical protein